MSDAGTIVDWLALRVISGIEAVSTGAGERSYRRTLVGTNGPRIGYATVSGGRAETTDDALAHLFDKWGLDARRAADERLLWAAERHGIHPLAVEIGAAPALPQPGCADPHEMLVRAIVGQLISVAAATKQLGFLAEAGDDLPVALQDDELRRLFPTMAQVAANADLLRVPAPKIAAVRAAAEAVATGEIEVARGADFDRMRRQLLGIKGIGPWTVGYLSLRMGDPDVLLTGDLVVRKGAKLLGIDDLPAFAELCAPYRSSLTLRCWAATARPSTRT